MNHVQYLGYIIDEQGVNVDSTKIQVTQKLLDKHNYLYKYFIKR